MNTIKEYFNLIKPNKVINVSQGDYLFNQNDAAIGVYIVQQGCIKLLRDTIDGNTVIFYHAQLNESLAEASLYSDYYHCHARADVNSIVEFYDKESVLKYLSLNIDSSLKFIEVLAKQIQRLRLLLELRSIRSARERLFQYLKLMSDDKGVFLFASTYKDLAITLGMTHETLYRVLSQLEKDKVIMREANKIILQI